MLTPRLIRAIKAIVADVPIGRPQWPVRLDQIAELKLAYEEMSRGKRSSVAA